MGGRYHHMINIIIMTLETLQKLGLSPNEAKIYNTLLNLKEAGVGQIASQSEVHRRNVYDAINRLIDKGLAFPIFSKGENFYAPVDPDKLLELVKEKEADLNKILPELRQRYKDNRGSQESYIYRGIEGLKNYMRDILRANQECYFLAAKGGWYTPQLAKLSEPFLKEATRKNIRMRYIFDAVIQDKGKDILKNFKYPYKYLPKEYSTDSCIDIFGDNIVTFSGLSFGKIETDLTIFVLRDSRLADSYKQWFEFIWQQCKK